MWQRPWVRWAALLLLLVVLVVAPLQLSEFTNQTLARIGVFAVAVLGLNVVMGYTGQVSLGQIFFVGLGAYITAYGVTERLEHRRDLRARLPRSPPSRDCSWRSPPRAWADSRSRW